MCNRRAFHKHLMHSQQAGYGRGQGHPGRKFWKEKFQARFNQPPTNVNELDDKYELHLFAAGLEKEDFLISVVDHILSIEVKRKEEDDNLWRRQEYKPGGFKRSFELNDKVDETAIEAVYENGVLVVSLPKLEGFETSRQEIEVV